MTLPSRHNTFEEVDYTGDSDVAPDAPDAEAVCPAEEPLESTKARPGQWGDLWGDGNSEIQSLNHAQYL